MKEIIIVRHAKSDWGTEFLQDADRPLNERGYRDAYAVSEWYQLHKPLPDLILTSNATRALNTALIFMRRLGLKTSDLRIEPDIYEAPADRLLKVLREAPNSSERLMMFGHNPGITNLCNTLGGSVYFDNVPTCGIVSMQADIGKWKDLDFKKASMNYYQFPKDFRTRE